MDRIRLFGWVYFIGFMAIVGLDFVPQFVDPEGRLFGLFTLDFYDNSLHFASGAWAAVAALWSHEASATYFRIFGPLYFLDGVMGFLLGSGYLDGGIFIYGVLELSWMIKFLANVPHLIIGGLAAWIGYRLARTPEPVPA